MQANRKAPDGTPRFAGSLLGLFCLPMSHKKDARLIWVKYCNIISSKTICHSESSIKIFVVVLGLYVPPTNRVNPRGQYKYIRLKVVIPD